MDDIEARYDLCHIDNAAEPFEYHAAKLELDQLRARITEVVEALVCMS